MTNKIIQKLTLLACLGLTIGLAQSAAHAHEGDIVLTCTNGGDEVDGDCSSVPRTGMGSFTYIAPVPPAMTTVTLTLTDITYNGKTYAPTLPTVTANTDTNGNVTKFNATYTHSDGQTLLINADDTKTYSISSDLPAPEQNDRGNYTIQQIPEPGTFVMMLFGLASLGGMRRRNRR